MHGILEIKTVAFGKDMPAVEQPYDYMIILERIPIGEVINMIKSKPSLQDVVGHTFTFTPHSLWKLENGTRIFVEKC